MLLRRILTALVLAPTALAGVHFLPTHWLAWPLLLLTLMAALEWLALAGVHQRLPQLGLLALFLVLGITVFYLPVLQWVLVWTAVLLWLPLMLLVLTYPASGRWLAQRPLNLLLPFLVLLGALAALLQLHQIPGLGPWYLTWLLLVIWCADIGAYFAGRALGRHKLAAKISPGKTWEGVVGGMLLALAAAALLRQLPMLAGAPTLVWMLGLALLLAAISVFGDLFESLLKRSCGVKDSGGLLPGHGGVLDRVDALLAAAPLAALVLVSFTLGN